jgi:uncharacterized protein
LLALVSCSICGETPVDSHYYDGYDARAPLHAVVEAETACDGYRLTEFSFEGLPGETVPALLTCPLEVGPSRACVIFLHGIGQDKSAIKIIARAFAENGFSVAAFDQYGRGDRALDEAGPIERLFALRKRGALTVIETRRLIDYLNTREDIDSDRLYLCGASYGAIVGVTAAAFDTRIHAAVLIYGGGNLPLLLDSQQARESFGVALWPLRYVAAWFLAPADPIRHVAGIAPRPVLFQNGTRDTIVPASSAQALFEAAKEPKEIIWYDSDHIGLDEETLQEVLQDALDWLKEQDQRVQEDAGGVVN